MRTQGRRSRFIGMAPLSVVTRYTEKDGYLAGHLHTQKGWHWHFSVELPCTWNGIPTHNGHVVRGPFPTEQAALEDADKHLNGNYHLPIEQNDGWGEHSPYVINNGQEGEERLWWNNDLGWVAPVESASHYGAYEMGRLALPMGGQWEDTREQAS